MRFVPTSLRSLNANDQVNRDAASVVPTSETADGGSGSTHCSFSAINPFKQFDGKTIERTEYRGGDLRLHFTDGTSGYVDIVVPTDKVSVREMLDYQTKGILILSGGIRKFT
jgi:hypothetical protein